MVSQEIATAKGRVGNISTSNVSSGSSTMMAGPDVAIGMACAANSGEMKKNNGDENQEECLGSDNGQSNTIRPVEAAKVKRHNK